MIQAFDSDLRFFFFCIQILTWRIHNYGNDGIPRSVIRRTFKRSLEKWSNETNLVFQQIYKGEPDIWFKFAVGAHGDPSPFKRPWDGVIAHAFYPKHNTQGWYLDNSSSFFAFPNATRVYLSPLNISSSNAKSLIDGS